MDFYDPLRSEKGHSRQTSFFMQNLNKNLITNILIYLPMILNISFLVCLCLSFNCPPWRSKKDVWYSLRLQAQETPNFPRIRWFFQNFYYWDFRPEFQIWWRLLSLMNTCMVKNIRSHHLTKIKPWKFFCPTKSGPTATLSSPFRTLHGPVRTHFDLISSYCISIFYTFLLC